MACTDGAGSIVLQVDQAMDGGGEQAWRPHEQVLLSVRPCEHEGVIADLAY